METMKLIMAEPNERMMLEYRHRTEVDNRSWYGEAQREGEKKGEKRMAELIKTLLTLGRVDEVSKAAENDEYRNQLFKELQIKNQ